MASSTDLLTDSDGSQSFSATHDWLKADVQVPHYEDLGELTRVMSLLLLLPPLTQIEEVYTLKARLAQATNGAALVLMGGDCAETFRDFSTKKITNLVQTFSDAAVSIVQATGLEPVIIGRVAGQFAKPRSSQTESIDNHTIESYRGDIINDSVPTARERKPDPERMVRAYAQAQVTVELLRRIRSGGKPGPVISTAHEMLLIPYDEALMRHDEYTNRQYVSSAHMLWIGERTRDPDGPYVSFAAAISNPIGVKLGPSAAPNDVLLLADRLDPVRESGRLIFIPRQGADLVGDRLPHLIRTLKAEGHRPLWLCDPMHANTELLDNGYRTRQFDNISKEAETFISVCRAEGVAPAGLHLEMTGDFVTECVGGTCGVTSDCVPRSYHSVMDPRLNASQALELVAFFTERVAKTSAQIQTDRGSE